MPAPISVIIPTLNAGDALESCLQALAPGVAAQLIREVIVVDGGSSDRTILPAYQSGARVICSAPGRGRQLRTGGVNAKGDFFLFLHADTFLEGSWADNLLRHLESDPQKAAAFTLAYRSPSPQARWLEKRANGRARLFGLPYGDQGLFISRQLYDETGGFPDQPLMEDVALIRKIGKSRLAILEARAFTSADKYERDGWRKRAYSNALLITRYFLGASPEKLAKKYT